jgi:FkbM family methyltransferase
MTKHVKIYQTAVCDHTGSQQIFLNTSGSNSLYSAPNSPNTSDFIEVPTDTLPNIMDSHNLQTIDFLRMDCEGAEGKILKSMPPDYLRRIKKIAMESHDGISTLDHNEFKSVLDLAGFKTSFRWNPKKSTG